MKCVRRMFLSIPFVIGKKMMEACDFDDKIFILSE